MQWEKQYTQSYLQHIGSNIFSLVTTIYKIILYATLLCILSISLYRALTSEKILSTCFIFVFVLCLLDETYLINCSEVQTAQLYI
jgi:hypothetical protein